MPQLMRDARDVYRHAVAGRSQPPGATTSHVTAGSCSPTWTRPHPDPKFSSQADVVASLGLSKQAASQLIDTLVLREYLERRNDPVDRRRMEVRLTERGRTAAIAIRTAIDAVEAALAH